MPRAIVFLLILLLLLGGALYFLSTQADEVPTQSIEVDVSAAGNAS